MGKLIASFLFFLTSAAFAVHEARPTRAPSPIAAAPSRPPERSDRVNVPRLPDSARFARPFYIRPLAAPEPPVPPPPVPKLVIVVDSADSSGDIPDATDRCPELTTKSDESEDGCPLDSRATSERTRISEQEQTIY